MAVYEYRCEDCGEEYEVWTQFHEESQCPACGSAEVVRMMSPTTFKLEGTGWYATDYKSKTPGNVPTKSDDTDSKTSDTDSKAADAISNDADSKTKSATCPAAGSSA